MPVRLETLERQVPPNSRMPYLPAGCDQQGRYPQVAEAATEVGVDDEHLLTDTERVMIVCIVIVSSLLSLAALVFVMGVVL